MSALPFPPGISPIYLSFWEPFKISGGQIPNLTVAFNLCSSGATVMSSRDFHLIFE